MDQNNEFRKYAVHHMGMSGNMVDDYNKKVTNMTPYVIEERPGNFRAIDVFTRLISDRIVFLGTGVDDQVANLLQAQLLFLESSDAKQPVKMYINSPGGSVYAGLGIFDTMNLIKSKVHTTCTGLAASMAAVLLAAGEKGTRAALKHSRVMIHQPMSGTRGRVSDMEIDLRETLELKKDLYIILADATGQTYDQIHTDCDRDKWFRASEAKTYGLIDNVVGE